MSTKTIFMATGAALFLAAPATMAAVSLSPHFQLQRTALPSGGAAATSPSFRQSSIVGQTAIGETNSAGFVLHHAFWGAQAYSLTAVDDRLGGPPDVFELASVRPNPFNPEIRICYSLATMGRTRLLIYDLKGRLVCGLVDEVQVPGRYEQSWSGRDGGGSEVASGVYFLVLRSGAHSATRKLTLLK